jgi:hypothetical protein
MILLGLLSTLVEHFFGGIIYLFLMGKNQYLSKKASRGLLELENEVKWMVNMLIMVYFGKNFENVTSE